VLETPADKAPADRRLQKRLSPNRSHRGDRSAGASHCFSRIAPTAINLFDSGGRSFPTSLLASGRTIDYLLENLVDPSGLVRDYQCRSRDQGGRVITGLVVAEAISLSRFRLNGKVVRPGRKIEIEDRRHLDRSMMPDGMLQNLSTTGARSVALCDRHKAGAAHEKAVARGE